MEDLAWLLKDVAQGQVQCAKGREEVPLLIHLVPVVKIADTKSIAIIRYQSNQHVSQKCIKFVRIFIDGKWGTNLKAARSTGFLRGGALVAVAFLGASSLDIE